MQTFARFCRLVQNDLFDVGADICRPERVDSKRQPLRVTAKQVHAIEEQIDRFNEHLNPLTSFVLPGGSPASAYLHLARTAIRRAERDLAELASNEPINSEALKYVNRRVRSVLRARALHERARHGRRAVETRRQSLG